MPYRNNYWKSIMGINAQVFLSLGVAYTAQTTYTLFVANSVEGEMGIFNATTQALIPGNAAVAAGTNIFIAVNRGGTKSVYTNAPQVPNVIETSVTFKTGASDLTLFRQPYDAPILQVTQIAMLSHASLTIGDITYRAKAAGAASAITITYVVAGASTALSVAVTGNAITVNLATSAGSAAISTATQVLAAIAASAPATALVSANITGTASTVQAAFPTTNLAGGSAAAVIPIGSIFGVRILETTIGYQPFPTWDYQYVSVAGDTEDTVAANLVGQINNKNSIANRDRDLVVTATYANGIITVTAIYFGSTFNLLMPGLQFPVLSTDNYLPTIATIVPVQTCHAGSGSADQVRLFQMAGDVYKGIATQYPLQGARPEDYGQPNDFVTLSVVKNFDIYSISGYKDDASRTFLHKQAFKMNIFVIVPTSGASPTAQIQTIFGL